MKIDGLIDKKCEWKSWIEWFLGKISFKKAPLFILKIMVLDINVNGAWKLLLFAINIQIENFS